MSGAKPDDVNIPHQFSQQLWHRWSIACWECASEKRRACASGCAQGRQVCVLVITVEVKFRFRSLIDSVAFLAFVLVFTCLKLKYRLEALTAKPGSQSWEVSLHGTCADNTIDPNKSVPVVQNVTCVWLACRPKHALHLHSAIRPQDIGPCSGPIIVCHSSRQLILPLGPLKRSQTLIYIKMDSMTQLYENKGKYLLWSQSLSTRVWQQRTKGGAMVLTFLPFSHWT